MKGKDALIAVVGLVAAFLVPLSATFGADYPTKPVSLIVAYPAGGSTDVGARILAAVAEKKFGQPILVVNKSGAGGQVGWTEIARQKPDGYGIGYINLPTFVLVILDPERKAAFKLDSFIPIINHVHDAGVIWVKADSPYKTLKDLIEDVKKHPGEVRASTTGIMSDDHLAILMLEQAAKVNFRMVHLDGSAVQMTATLGGQVDVSFDNVGAVTPRVMSGQVRCLAVMDKERSKFIPDVPTTVELGYPTVISAATRGIAAPKGTPGSVVKKLQEVLSEAMKDPAHVEKMEKAGLAIRILVGEEYGKYIQEVYRTASSMFELARKTR